MYFAGIFCDLLPLDLPHSLLSHLILESWLIIANFSRPRTVSLNCFAEDGAACAHIYFVLYDPQDEKVSVPWAYVSGRPDVLLERLCKVLVLIGWELGKAVQKC